MLLEVLNKISNAQEDDIFASSEPQAQQDTPTPEAESN